MNTSDAVSLIADELIPAWRKERRKLNKIDRWARWKHDAPHHPRQSTREYRELASRAQAPWGDLVVTSVAQTLYVEGYRSPDQPDPIPAIDEGAAERKQGAARSWEIWQANGLDARQVPIHKAALTYGLAYGMCLPGRTLSGDPMPQMRGVSPRDMIALYDDPAIDDWPEYALRMVKLRKGYRIQLLDDTCVYETKIDHLGDTIRSDSLVEKVHDAGVCPVVRYKNRFDLEGRSAGEVEPFIPLLGRIDQTSFDRLVVQRFAAWVVRYATGMDLSKSAEQAGLTEDQMAMRLKVGDMLVSASKDTKFGTLDGTALDGFIKAGDADKADLAAVSQTPAFELLGQMSNLSAEALAAAKSSQTAKSDERQIAFGEDHEQFLRLASHLDGDAEGAEDFMAQVRWKDTSIRSLAQAVDAYGKLAQMLGYPADLLWGKVPGLSEQDVDEARDRAEEEGGILTELQRLTGAIAPSGVESADEIKKRFDALGTAIRAGVDPQDAARKAGLDVAFTGAIPVSLRPPAAQADSLE